MHVIHIIMPSGDCELEALQAEVLSVALDEALASGKTSLTVLRMNPGGDLHSH